MTKIGMSLVFATALLLPGSIYSQPTKAVPSKAVVKVLPTKTVAKATLPAKVVVSVPASMAHVVVKAPATSQPVVTLAVVPTVAKAVPASESAPVAAWRAWIRDNWRYILFVIVLPSIITALKKKGVREGIVGFLESVLERASLAQPHNSYGTLKWPGQAAGPPVDPPKPPEPPKA